MRLEEAQWVSGSQISFFFLKDRFDSEAIEINMRLNLLPPVTKEVFLMHLFSHHRHNKWKTTAKAKRNVNTIRQECLADSGL